MPTRQLMTPQQAAEYLGIAKHTLARWRVEGEGPPFLKLGGPVRYDVADLDAWIDARRRRSTSGTA
jgi:excisionase family DNA binding protein